MGDILRPLVPRKLAAPSDRRRTTKDKPTVTFAPPKYPNTISHELTLRVPDCQAAYETLKARGAEFLTPPVDWGGEIRCFFRDPDGNLWRSVRPSSPLKELWNLQVVTCGYGW